MSSPEAIEPRGTIELFKSKTGRHFIARFMPPLYPAVYQERVDDDFYPAVWQGQENGRITAVSHEKSVFGTHVGDREEDLRLFYESRGKDIGYQVNPEIRSLAKKAVQAAGQPPESG